jgi:hypothetical protein
MNLCLPDEVLVSHLRTDELPTLLEAQDYDRSRELRISLARGASAPMESVSSLQ